MNRRAVLRRGVGAVALSVPLAGCGGDDGTATDDGTEANGGSSNGTESDGGDESSPETDTVTETSEPTETVTVQGESIGSVAENTVEELVIVDWESQSPGEIEAYPVAITVRNTGDQETNLINYNLELTVYDDSDTDISDSYSGFSAVESTVAPGSEQEVTISTGVSGQLEDVARYEITLNCEMGAGGVYC